MQNCRFIGIRNMVNKILIDTNILLDYLLERAKAYCADYIVTRNIPDYAASEIKAITPEAYLKLCCIP